jgi:hypothetical protein
MNTKRFKLLAAGLVLLLAVLACQAPVAQQSEPTIPGEVFTQTVQTLTAQQTQSAMQTAIAQLTQMAGGVSPTAPGQPSATPSPTPQPSQATQPPATAVPASPTPRPPTPTSTPLPCDRASFAGDVTVKDNTVFSPGAKFTKTWRLKNVGTCTWTTAYSLVFVNGNSLSGDTEVGLPNRVRPGETVDVSVTLKAPSREGTYKGFWMLRNDAGEDFGIGDNADSPFWVQIRVLAVEANPDYNYDFAANFCNADWTSGAGGVNCAGSETDPQGSVILLSEPRLESRNENELALWTRPSNGRNGWISGQYPAYTVQNQDHFLAEIGCLANSSGCDVTFQLQYETTKGVVKDLGTWGETYDGKTQIIDIDLSSLAGQKLQFILTVMNNGRAKNPNAFWFVPHISKVVPKPAQVLTWHHSNGTEGCQELRVYLTGTVMAEAEAFDCSSGQAVSLGRTRLNDSQLNQMVTWVNAYKSFETDTTPPDESTSAIAWIKFKGKGTGMPTSNDMQAMASFAATIFRSIAQ